MEGSTLERIGRHHLVSSEAETAQSQMSMPESQDDVSNKKHGLPLSHPAPGKNKNR